MTAWSRRIQARKRGPVQGFAVVSQEGEEITLAIGVVDPEGHEITREIGLTGNMAVDLAHELDQAAAKAVLRQGETE